MKIDHVALWCNDLHETAAQLFEETGLASAEGGWFETGIAQILVPLGNDQFIEIESVVDRRKWDEALASFGLEPFGRFLDDKIAGGPALVGYWILTDDIEAKARALGAEIMSLSKTQPDGNVISGRGTPPTPDAIQRGLPSFWVSDSGGMEVHGSRARVEHRVEPAGISWLEVGGDEQQLRAWFGPEGEALPLRFAGGSPGIRAMGIATEDGDEIVLRPSAGSLRVR